MKTRIQYKSFFIEQENCKYTIVDGGSRVFSTLELAKAHIDMIADCEKNFKPKWPDRHEINKII